MIAGIIIALVAACGDQDHIAESIESTDADPPDVVIDGQPGTDADPPDVVIDEQPSIDTPDGDLLEQARAWFAGQELPDEGIPPGFIALDRLVGECVRSFGVEVLEPEAAYRSGVYYYRSGDQPERVNAINTACERALADLKVDPSTFTIIYESYIAVHECLVENGFPVSDPPTLETFIDSPHSWTPWVGMIGDSSPVLLVAPPTGGPLATYYESLLSCPRP